MDPKVGSEYQLNTGTFRWLVGEIIAAAEEADEVAAAFGDVIADGAAQGGTSEAEEALDTMG